MVPHPAGSTAAGGLQHDSFNAYTNKALQECTFAQRAQRLKTELRKKYHIPEGHVSIVDVMQCMTVPHRTRGWLGC